MSQEIKAVVFDVDGMLINGPIFSQRLEKEYEISQSITQPFFDGPYRPCSIGKANLKTELSKVYREWGWKKTLDELLYYWFDGDKPDKEMLEEVNRVKEKGIKVCLATNNDSTRQAFIMQNYFPGLFDEVFCSGVLGVLKPSKEFMNAITKKLNLAPEEILFWDDNDKNVNAAKSSGFQAEKFTSHDAYVKKMKELLIY